MPHPTLRRLARLVAPAALCLALHGVVAEAVTIPVTTDTDTDFDDSFCSLREAIVAANTDAAYNGCPAGSGADRIVFALVPPVTITIVSALPVISATLSIRGPGADALTIDGQDAHQLLHIDSPAGGEWLFVTDLTLTRGLAAVHGGGAVLSLGDNGYFQRVHFLANRASNGGGGLSVTSNATLPAVVGIEQCWFEDNLSLGATGGGGLYLTGALAQVVVDRTTFSGNQAQSTSGNGGGIRQADGALTISRSTFSGNRANSHGGAIWVQAQTIDSSLTLRDSTLTLNEADANVDGTGDGGGLSLATNVGRTALLDLTNTIVADNIDSGGTDQPDVSASALVTLDLTSHGFNLIGSNAGGTTYFSAGLPNGDGDWIGTSGSPIDPLLEPLALNGGQIPTHRPISDPATPVVDKGFCTGSGADQRGFGDAVAHVRIVDTAAPNGPGSDGCDIGAYERGGAAQAAPLLFADDFESGYDLYWDAAMP
ncbi:MAG: CSLREA domain-containing protein [Acidobacteria bacterium]|nr:CSLREA domain-containing protein [Acidobacteriota bacterium]